ncbi:MAG: hypothetical protein JXL80_03170 [Planctomycetes bacterium]|nr:hypothetical protein [Planctomycetota bacterium]
MILAQEVVQYGMTYADYGAIGGYILLMIIVGLVCRNISGNISDYIRMGGKSTWWMAGLSVFMASFSAATFTGYAAQAYLAGWSFVINYIMVAIIFFIQAAIFAPWMRNTRAVTPFDAIRLRFGPKIEQMVVWIGLPGSFIWSGMFLLTLATFVSTVFGFTLWQVILVVGVVLVFYSVMGGSWSVQITDNLQSFLLLPIVTVLAFLALKHIGWIDGLFGAIKEQNLTADFALLKSSDHVYTSSAAKVKPMFYTWPWLAAMICSTFMGAVNMNSCYRYLSIKTGRDARKAAILAGTLTLLGAFIWGLPAMVGRLSFAAQIEALPLKAPADGAYAVTAMNLLPPGLLGLVVVAMFAATMSSMDSNLTGTAGNLTKNLYVPLAKFLGFKPLEGRKLLLLAKLLNLGLGLWAIGAAFLFHKFGSSVGIFGIMQEIMVLVGVPLGTPFVVSFLMKRVPKWAPVVGLACGVLTTVTLKFSGAVFGWFGYNGDILTVFGLHRELYWHEQFFVVSAAALVPTMLTRFFWFTSDATFRQRVDNFFRTIHTPVNVEKEVGREIDHSQLKTVGGLGLIMTVFLTPLIFTARTFTGHMCVIFIWTFVLVISGLMYLRGRRAASLEDEVEAKRVADGDEALRGDEHGMEGDS